MWFHLGFKNFVAKKIQKDDSCEIFVSDFMRIWHKSLSNYELLSISQELNPLFEAPVQKLKDLTVNLLRDMKARKEVIEEGNNNILVKLESNVMNIKFRFHVTLNRGDENMFYKEFTFPLLLELIRIQDREKKLIEVISNKDTEIKDYKQGYGITPNYLTTKPFSKKEFYRQEAANIPWDNSFLECINSKLVAIETTSHFIQEKLPLDGKSEKMHLDNESDKTSSVFEDKSLNQSSSSKAGVLLDNKVIKKIKKHNDGFKIKL